MFKDKQSGLTEFLVEGNLDLRRIAIVFDDAKREVHALKIFQVPENALENVIVSAQIAFNATEVSQEENVFFTSPADILKASQEIENLEGQVKTLKKCLDEDVDLVRILKKEKKALAEKTIQLKDDLEMVKEQRRDMIELRDALISTSAQNLQNLQKLETAERDLRNAHDNQAGFEELLKQEKAAYAVADLERAELQLQMESQGKQLAEALEREEGMIWAENNSHDWLNRALDAEALLKKTEDALVDTMKSCQALSVKNDSLQKALKKKPHPDFIFNSEDGLGSRIVGVIEEITNGK